jgi:hypothetical protein
MATRVDLTAMVDLAFLLITFFILTTTLANPHVMPLVMTDKSHPDVNAPYPETRTLTICLGKGNKVVYYLGLPDRPLMGPLLTGYGRKGIRRVIMENQARLLAKTGKSLIVIIKPGDHSVYANLVDALDEMSITKTDQFAVADLSAKDMEMMKRQALN